MEVDNYYKFRDVERIPKALRNIHDAIFVKQNGGFLVLDTDLPDTRMNIVFLLDYLVENSGYNLISVADCVASSVEYAGRVKEKRSVIEEPRTEGELRDRVIDKHSDNSNNHIKLI